MRLRSLCTAALLPTLAAFGADAATLTCQNRSVHALASWAPVTDGDSSRAGDFGLFDGNADALVFASYPLYTAAASHAYQRSEIAADGIQAQCRAEAQFVTWSGQTGTASSTRKLTRKAA